jgi:fructose-1,6-bisphosphatase/sedoheptulose 1,7-bisphosphatase-like protein
MAQCSMKPAMQGLLAILGGSAIAIMAAGSSAAQNTSPKDYWYCIGGSQEGVVYSAVFRRTFSYMNVSMISSDWRQSRAFKYLSRDASLTSQCAQAGNDPNLAKVHRDEAVANLQKTVGASQAIDTEWSP